MAVIEVGCNGCGEFPWWAQAILTLIGLGLAMGVLYVPYRLSRLARTPRQRAIIRIGGTLALTIGLVVLARIAVLVLPD